MKTKQIPAIVMLLAGLVICVIGFMEQMKWAEFLKLLLIVLLIFYIIGCIGKAVLDLFFKEPEMVESAEQAEESDDSDEAENTTEEGKDSIAGEDEE